MVSIYPQTGKPAMLISLRGFFQGEHTWADLFYFLIFFIIGYLMPADPRFTESIKRHGWICLPFGIAGFLAEFYLIFNVGYNYPGGARLFTLWALSTLPNRDGPQYLVLDCLYSQSRGQVLKFPQSLAGVLERNRSAFLYPALDANSAGGLVYHSP